MKITYESREKTLIISYLISRVINEQMQDKILDGEPYFHVVDTYSMLDELMADSVEKGSFTYYTLFDE